MFKLNHINKISPYFLEQSDVINNIIIENDDIHPILVTFENLTLSSKNKIQFIGINIELKITDCILENIMTLDDIHNMFIDYNEQNISINFENIFNQNHKLCKCFEPLPEDLPIDTEEIDYTGDSFDLATTFSLHSKLGSNKFIYLNFVGYTMTDSVWNTYANKSTITVPPYASPFTDTAKQNIQYIWRSISDAYSIWDVDVTTEKPTDLELSNATSKKGIQCLIGGSSINVLGISAGGIAYLYSFTTNPQRSCFVFPLSLSNVNKYIATAATHEVGHTLGLSHKGTTTGSEYYTGNSVWAPFMGVGYYTPVNQWSKGEYANANNTVDEISAISVYLNFIADDVQDSFINATLLQNGISFDGIINNRTDVDMYKLNLNNGSLNITTAVTSLLPTLKVGMTLYNSSFSIIATNNINIASNSSGNMDASISYNVTSSGLYYLKIAGVGGDGLDNSGNPVTSFNDYGSIGRYKVTGTWNESQITISTISIIPNNKVYDKTTNATVNISSTNVVDGDDIIFSCVAKFNNKTVGNNKPITITNITISGNDSSKYILSNSLSVSGIVANITKKPLTLTGITAVNKIYNGLTTAQLNTTKVVLTGLISGDKVTLTKPRTGLFNDKTVGNDKAVITNGFIINGTDSGNYSLEQPTYVTANITPRQLNILGTTVRSKIYDGTTTAIIDVSKSKLSSAKLVSDDVVLDKSSVVGNFIDAIIGTRKKIIITGFAISGNDSTNYQLNQPTNLIANITKR